MKKLVGSILGCGAILALSLNLLHSQTSGGVNFNGNLGLGQATGPDSIVQITADAAGLNRVGMDGLENLPRSGTYWWILPNGTAVPAPCPPLDLSAPIFQMGEQWLVDLTVGAAPTMSRRSRFQAQTMGSTAVTPLESEATMIADLILRVQSAEVSRQMRMLGMDVPGFDDIGNGGGGTNEPLYTIDYVSLTNGLWLELTNISNGYAWLNLHNATHTGGVYEIFSKTDLTAPSWNIEGALWPKDTNCQPFVLSLNAQSPSFFVWARDWTGVTSGGNQTPEWWFYYYFGSVDLSDSTPDGGGIHTLGYDYANGLDPNVIQFSIESTNDYIVNTTSASLQLNITAGAPVYYAWFLNSTTSTNWLPFTTTNLTVPLGSTDGVYTVHMGLRGLPADATQTWDDYPITLDRVAPVVTIANPGIASGAATVIKPFLQLQGIANKQLSSLSYDISNSAGLLTNQPGYVTDQYFDQSRFDFTTNTFQCYDVPLTTNDNYITLRLTDRAGNTTTTNFDVVLDYTTATNPVMVLTWPTNGMEICQSNFTLRGWVDDETATVAASITDTNGNTTTLSGEVERSGVLWVDDLPLNSGTNWVTLSATNAAGLSSTTTIMVVKSEMTLALTSIQGDLWQPFVNVSGVVDPGYTVCVNGVLATTNSNGTWFASNVPISASGVASFDMSASLDGGDPYANTNVVKDPKIVVVGYQELKDYHNQNSSGEWGNEILTNLYSAHVQMKTNGDYNATWNGYSDLTKSGFHENAPYSSDISMSWTDTNSTETDAVNGNATYVGVIQDGYWEDGWPTPIPDTDITAYCASCGPTESTMTHFFAHDAHADRDFGGGDKEVVSVNAQTILKLFTGGRRGVNRMNLFCINVGATEYGIPPLNQEYFGYPWRETTGTNMVDKTRLRLLNQEVGADGNLWISLPDNANPDLNLYAAGARHYSAWVTPTKYYIASRCHAFRQDLIRTNVGVGEEVDVFFSSDPVGIFKLTLPARIAWQTTAGSLLFTNTICQTTLTSPSNAATATVTATVGGASVSIGFNVLEPSGIIATIRGLPDYYQFLPSVGAGMRMNVVLQPTTVSFGRVEIKEPGATATGRQGYFINNPPPDHDDNHGANAWHQANSDNLIVDGVFDHASSSGWPIGQGGTYTWPIQPVWSVGTNGLTHPLSGWTDQVHILGSDGTMTVQKLGHTVTRSPNQFYGTTY